MVLVGFQGRNHPQQVKRSGARPEIDERQTPPELFDPLNERFRFTLDACALPRNAKLERYFTPDDDGLAQPWAGERVWCNPPYSDIEPWVVKAQQEHGRPERGSSPIAGAPNEIIVMLVPANRTEQGWWQRYVEPYRDNGNGLSVEFIAKRQRFIRHDAGEIKPNERPPFGVCLLIWDGA